MQIARIFRDLDTTRIIHMPLLPIARVIYKQTIYSADQSKPSHNFREGSEEAARRRSTQ